jgi:hypothetical protein
VDKQLAEYDKQLADYDKQINEKIAGIESYTKAETLDDNTKTAFGLGGSAVPKDVFGVIKATLDNRARIVTGSYTGTGKYGVNNPNSLSFPFQPKFLILTEGLSINVSHMDWAVWYEGLSYINCCNNSSGMKIMQSGNELSWSCELTAHEQFNAPNTTYHYIAIG